MLVLSKVKVDFNGFCNSCLIHKFNHSSMQCCLFQIAGASDYFEVCSQNKDDFRDSSLGTESNCNKGMS